MNTQGLLDQLLKSASGALSGNSSTNSRQGSQSGGGASQLGSLLSGAGGGALAAGAVGLLLGNKKARKMGGATPVRFIYKGKSLAAGDALFFREDVWHRTQDETLDRVAFIMDVLRLPLPDQAELNSTQL